MIDPKPLTREVRLTKEESEALLDHCIEWDRGLSRSNGNGYGVVTVHRKRVLVHRAVWEENHGAIPTGLRVLHKCDNRPCINIDHLYLGTMTDNARDMVRRRRQWKQQATHCPRGHVLAGENLDRYNLKKGHRVCAICQREYARKLWHLRKHRRVR